MRSRSYSQSSRPIFLFDCLVLQAKPPVTVFQFTRDEIVLRQNLFVLEDRVFTVYGSRIGVNVLSHVECCRTVHIMCTHRVELCTSCAHMYNCAHNVHTTHCLTKENEVPHFVISLCSSRRYLYDNHAKE
jgi:hypothetical protein